MVQNLENALTWRCRTCSVNDLTMMLTFSLKRRNHGDMSEKFFNEVVQTLERRWVEIVDPDLAIILFKHANIFKAKLLAKIEDRMIEKAEELSSESLVIVS